MRAKVNEAEAFAIFGESWHLSMEADGYAANTRRSYTTALAGGPRKPVTVTCGPGGTIRTPPASVSGSVTVVEPR